MKTVKTNLEVTMVLTPFKAPYLMLFFLVVQIHVHGIFFYRLINPNILNPITTESFKGKFVLRIMTVTFWILECRVYFLYISYFAYLNLNRLWWKLVSFFILVNYIFYRGEFQFYETMLLKGAIFCVHFCDHNFS